MPDIAVTSPPRPVLSAQAAPEANVPLRVRVDRRAQAVQAAVMLTLYAMRDRFRQRVTARAEAGDHTIQVVIAVLAFALIAIAVGVAVTGTTTKWVNKIKALGP